LAFGETEVPDVRVAVGQFARECGLSDGRVDDLVLAADELATNSVRYGGGSGAVLMWADADAVVTEFTDGGTIAAPLVGRLRPAVHSYGGRGIFLVNQVTDLVQIRSGPSSTRVRVTMWR
jgi:anti-sigma regulatory factor (Ser/Thr protein kinase)